MLVPSISHIGTFVRNYEFSMEETDATKCLGALCAFNRIINTLVATMSKSRDLSVFLITLNIISKTSFQFPISMLTLLGSSTWGPFHKT